jgi:hypothetical protein
MPLATSANDDKSTLDEDTPIRLVPTLDETEVNMLDAIEEARSKAFKAQAHRPEIEACCDGQLLTGSPPARNCGMR